MIEDNKQFYLFGVFAVHSPESCPLNNDQSKYVFMQIESKMKSKLSTLSVKRVIGFYMSVLEHRWIIIFEAANAHDVETLCIEAGISKYNTIKIVPLNNFDVVRNKMGTH